MLKQVTILARGAAQLNTDLLLAVKLSHVSVIEQSKSRCCKLSPVLVSKQSVYGSLPPCRCQDIISNVQ
jgi:hypothetical protein